MSSKAVFNYVQSIPKLGAKNYHDWGFSMCMVLEQAEIWELIMGAVKPIPTSEETATSDWLKSSALGYHLIVMGLTEEVKWHVQHIIDNWGHGPHAWSILKDQFGKSMTISHIKMKRWMFNTYYDPEKGMSAYCSVIIECSNKLWAMGKTIGPKDILDVILANLPAKFATYGASLMLCLTTLSTEQLSNFLMDHEKGLLQKGEETPVVAAYVRQMQGKKSGDGRNGGVSKWSKACKCFQCREPGHVATNCPAPKPVSLDNEGEASAVGLLALSAGVLDVFNHMNKDGTVVAQCLEQGFGGAFLVCLTGISCCCAWWLPSLLHLLCSLVYVTISFLLSHNCLCGNLLTFSFVLDGLGTQLRGSVGCCVHPRT